MNNFCFMLLWSCRRVQRCCTRSEQWSPAPIPAEQEASSAKSAYIMFKTHAYVLTLTVPYKFGVFMTSFDCQDGLVCTFYCVFWIPWKKCFKNSPTCLYIKPCFGALTVYSKIYVYPTYLSAGRQRVKGEVHPK